METLKKCAPPSPVFNHLCMRCVITLLTPLKTHNRPPVILSCDSSSFSPFLPLSFPQSSPARSNRRKNYPGCPLISPESFFPGWKHCHPFSLSTVPPSPFYQCQMITSGETELGNNMRRVGQGERGQKHLLLYLLRPSIRPSILPLAPLMPSRHPTHAPHPCASRGRWQRPKPISKEFPC